MFPEVQLENQSDLSPATWITHWRNRESIAPSTPKVPLSACLITTPLSLSGWRNLLTGHPNQELVRFFLTGISEGFRIGYNYTKFNCKSARRNLYGAVCHPEIVDQYLQNEISLGRVIGPFPVKSVPDVHLSRFGVIPKNHQPDKWRLIVDLSFPSGTSVNDGIPKELCSLKYITVDHAIEHIVSMGQGALLAKIDVQSAFRLLPVHPADRHLLGMQWKGNVYIDGCLPFGLRSAPKLFNWAAEFLEWILLQQGVSPLLHYLDDFLTIAPPMSDTCRQNLATIKHTCQILGVPLAWEKVEGPSTTLSFLGVLLDTAKMEARLPEEKLQRLQSTIDEWMVKKKATKREILSLVGQLQHAAKVVRAGRTFVARMYSTASKVKELHFYTRLNASFRSDVCWWHTFLGSWNGFSLLRWIVSIQTDASGSWGCGALFDKKWLQWQWPPSWSTAGIMAKELVPLLLSCAVWGPALSRRNVLFECDNSSVVAAVNKGSAKEAVVMHLLRCLWFFVAYYDITIIAKHIPGVANSSADHLSRCHMSLFFCSNPQADPAPAQLPTALLTIISTPDMDWTSAAFGRQFTSIISTAWHHPPTRSTTQDNSVTSASVTKQD